MRGEVDDLKVENDGLKVEITVTFEGQKTTLTIIQHNWYMFPQFFLCCNLRTKYFMCRVIVL